MEVRRNFSLNLIFLLVLNLLVKPIYLFGIEVGVQNEVGAASYGMYYAMFNFTILFNVILDLGISNFQKIRVAQNAEEGIKNMSSLVPLKLALSGLYMLCVVTAALLLGYDESFWFFIGWLMLNHVLSTFLLLIRANLSGLHLFIRDSILSVVDRSLLILMIGYLLWFSSEGFDIKYFVWAQTISYALAIVVGMLLLPRNHRGFSISFDRDQLTSTLRQCWPFAMLILIMTAYHKLDGIMIERLAPDGLSEAGIYAQAYRLLDAGNNFAFLYAGLLLPMFARLIAARDNENIQQLMDQAARMLIVPAGVVLIITWFHGEWLMELLYASYIMESTACLQWLMGSFIFIASSYVFSTMITASEKLRSLNLIGLGTVLINVVLNYLLIPKMGAEGAALTSFVSLAFMGIAQMVLVTRSFRIQHGGWTLRAFALWGGMSVVGFAAHSLELATHINILLMIGLSILGFFTFVVDLSFLKSMLASKK